MALDLPDLLIHYEVLDGSTVIHRGTYRLSDYGERRAFAMRAHEMMAEGYEVRTWCVAARIALEKARKHNR